MVNIFAIASGHMYERLQKIMVLSVLRHTNAKVKFWLIKNYMSPEMKRMMPLMAQEFGFEVCCARLVCSVHQTLVPCLARCTQSRRLILPSSRSLVLNEGILSGVHAIRR